MDKYFKKRTHEESNVQDQQTKSLSENQFASGSGSNEQQVESNVLPCVKINLDDLPTDPGLRKSIYSYNANDRELVRRAYLQRGPCQDRNYSFPWTTKGNDRRRFIAAWFNEHGSWLEYSIAKDAAFCLCCYLFKPERGDQGGGDHFVGERFRNWKSKQCLHKHVGGHNSTHTQCLKACEDLMNASQHIEVSVSKQSDRVRADYRTCLTASIDCIRFLLCQGLAFRGHDESEKSTNEENFLELLHFLSDHNEDIKRVVLKNAPENLKMISSKIQKDIVNAAAVETTNIILKDLGDELFSILVDESCDISVKEQMAVVLRYVNKKGCIIERFLGIVHVGNRMGDEWMNDCLEEKN